MQLVFKFTISFRFSKTRYQIRNQFQIKLNFKWPKKNKVKQKGF